MGYNIGPTISVQGESEYAKAMQQVRQNMAYVKAEANNLTSAFTRNDKSAEALTAQNKALALAQAEQRKAVEAAQNALNAMTERGVDPSSDAYRAMNANLNNAQAALNRTTAEIEQNERALRDMASEADDAGREVQDVGDSADKAGGGLGSLSTAAVAGVAAVVAIAQAAVEAAKALWEMTTQAAAGADELLTLSTQTGVSAQTLQEWTYAARFVDTEVEDMANGLTRVTKSIGAAVKAGQEHIAITDSLSVSIKDSNGKLKSTEAVFYDVIDALGAMTDETQRDIATQEIFGKSYQDMVPLIKAGSGAIRELGQEARDAGVIMSDEMVGQLGAVDDAMQRVEASTDAAKNSIAVALAPIVEGIAGKVKDGASLIATSLADGLQASDLKELYAWAKGVIGPVLESAVKAIPTILPKILKAAIGFLRTEVFANLGELIQVGIDLLIGMMTALVDVLPDTIGSVVDGIVDVIKTLTDADNIATIIALAVDIVLALMQGLFEALPTLLSALPNIISGIVGGLIKALPILVAGCIELVTMLVTELPTIIVGIYEAIPGMAKDIWNSIKTAFLESVTGAEEIGGLFSDSFWQGIDNSFDRLAANLRKWCYDLIEVVVSTFPRLSSLVGLDDLGASLYDDIYGANIPSGQRGQTASFGYAVSASKSAQATYGAQTVINVLDPSPALFDHVVRDVNTGLGGYGVIGVGGR